MDEFEDLLGGTTGSSSESGKKPLILIVDDEENYQKLLEFNLKTAGYDVITASDGQEGLDRARASLPDLILLDGLLPRVHGFEVCKTLKSEAATKDIPIIIMTAVYRNLRYKYEVKGDYGANEFVTKPFDIEDLVKRIKELL
jgi:DNA-binding response OmpR family regulator